MKEQKDERFFVKNNTVSNTQNKAPCQLLGYSVFSGSLGACADAIATAAANPARDCRIMACLNPHSYVVARGDRDFRHALEVADWLVPDGSGIVLAARWLRYPLIGRVTGPDTFLAVMSRLDTQRGSVFFLGSTDEVLDKIRTRMATEFPHVVLAGTYSPPYKAAFSEADNAEMLAAINITRPGMLWVGMTAPKQEKWLAENRTLLDVGAAGAVGAGFDFFAGTVKRSPSLFRALGLEWLPRLLQQPRRLWRRMFISAPVFLADVFWEKWHRHRG